MKMRVALAQYPIGQFSLWQDYEQHMRRWLQPAFDAQAELVVLPEYCAMELASLFGENRYCDISRQLADLQSVLPYYLELFSELACENSCTLVAGTFPVEENYKYINRCHVFLPDGSMKYQDKLMMTRFEREQWEIVAGSELRVIETPKAMMGIAVCYDIEFPLISRRLCTQGAEIIVVPSCTDTMAGYHRVRIGCQARALENQCYVMHASTVGDALWNPAVDTNVGSAAIYTPSDNGFPEDGVLSRGRMSEPCWLIEDIDLSTVEYVREHGEVLNVAHWAESEYVYSARQYQQSPESRVLLEDPAEW